MRKRRIAGWSAGVVLGIVLLVLVAVLILGRSEWGTRQVGERAITFLDDQIAGDITVGSVSGGGILRGVTLHDVVVTDSLGRPVLRADSARLGYALRSFLGGDVVLNRVELWRPYAVLEKLPGEESWNFERAFADPSPDTAQDRPEKSDPLVLLERAILHDGTVVVRMPWEPDATDPVEPADTANLILEPESGGLVRVMRFEELNGELPRILISSPAGEGRMFRIASLSTRAFLFETPLELEQLGGTIALRDSLLSIDLGELRLPDTRASGVAQLVLTDTMTFDVELDVAELALSDFRWLKNDLPEDGRAEGEFRVQKRPDGSTVVLGRDLDLSAPGTRVTGDFGVILGDTLSFTNVDLHADPLDLDFIGSLIPGGLPVEGLMIGDVRIQGPISAVRTSGDVQLVDRGHTSRVQWSGTVDARRDWAVRDFEASFRNLDPRLVARITPHESLNPTHPLSGRVVANGDTRGRLRVEGELDLANASGSMGHVDAVVTVDGPAARRVDVDLRTREFALPEVERWVPALRVLRGRASGPVRLVFDGDTMTLDADVVPNGGGRLTLDGTFSREEPGGFVLHGALTDVQVGSVIDKMPESRATGTFDVVTAPGEERARITAELTDGEFLRLPIRSARMVAWLQDGVLDVDTGLVQTAAARIAAAGSLGVDSTTTGAMRIRALGDSLSWLAPMLGLSDTLVGGSGEFDGVLEGNTHALRLNGAGRLGRGHISVYAADRARYDGTMLWQRGSLPAGEFNVVADNAVVAGRRLGQVELAASVDPALRGRVDLGVSTPFSQRYELTADYAVRGDTTDLYVERAVIADGSEHWQLTTPGVVRMRPTGSRIQSLALVEANGGRLELAGFIPWRAPWARETSGPARAVDLLGNAQQAPINALVRLVDPESSLSGIASGTFRVEGTADSPLMSADGDVVAVRYQDVAIDTIDVSLRHVNHVSEWRVGVRHDGRDMLTGRVTLPIQVAFAPFRLKRLDLPMSGSIRADVMPAAIPAGLVGGLDRVTGTVSGQVDVRGTPFAPELAGGFMISNGAFTLAATDVRYRDVNGALTVTSTQDFGVDVTATTGAGSALALTGTITLDQPDNPQFALRLEATNMLLARRRDIDALASGYADLTGRYRSPRVTGRLLLIDGALHLDELIRQTQVVALENPLLVDVIDTTQIAVQRILRESRNPFLEGLYLRVAIDVPGNFWVRSEELNVETAGFVDLSWDPATHNLQMFGQVNAVRGFYNVRAVLDLPVRRFQVREGSINFVGVPGINPNLDIVAVYRARTQNNDLLEILALVEGTMRNPRIRLTSESDPPISESDLASYLLFGRPSYALSQAESATLAGSQIATGFGTPLLFGLVASEFEAFGSEYGLFDYFSITNDEYVQQVQELQANTGAASILAGTRFEVGRYFADEWFVATTLSSTAGPEQADGLTWEPGGRIEWRFHPTWNAQLFWENRLAHAATRGFDPNLDNTSVMGIFLAREWGY
ncbi:MAG TPA: translocation/assembly module TamB domain-containing protein [Longimicrobiales bacterium]